MNIILIQTEARFDKNYRKLSKKVKLLAQEREAIFRVAPFHPILKTHKLHGYKQDVWAFSVNQKYRIQFIFLNDKSVLFLDIGTHDVYQ